MSAFPLGSIVIVGNSASTWLAAAMLARVLGASCQLRVLEIPDESAITGAIASVPSLHRLRRLLGIDEAALMRSTQATFRLGASFRDWAAIGDRYFHGLGSVGAKLDAVPFQHHWLRLAAMGESHAFEDFSMAAQAARLERFALPQSDPRSVLSMFSYAWHFDARLLAAQLRAWALRNGVVAVSGEIAEVEFDPERRFLRSLTLRDGSRLEGRQFIDCAGALWAALGVQLDDWSAWLPCDRALTLRCAPTPSLPPYSECSAWAHGWQSSMPLQDCTVRQLVYCSEFVTDDAANAYLMTAPNKPRDTGEESPRPQRLTRGRPKEFWVKNCLLLPGETLDPLESSGLHLAQTGISRFLAHLPVSSLSPVDAAEYNRATVHEYDRLRDLLVLHYHASRRDDSPFWARCRAAPVPESLRQRIALFADSGRITVGEDEFCGGDGWLSVLLGQGVSPGSYDPLADVTSLATARAALTNLSREMRAQATALPTHRAFIMASGASASTQ
ncbi:MAG TPA: tryptophan halogenase family protein [Steroidobacteraceae bacterium]|nr:tryptophan halogenase family protein [Steroidobacteraceae bacterium]